MARVKTSRRRHSPPARNARPPTSDDGRTMREPRCSSPLPSVDPTRALPAALLALAATLTCACIAPLPPDPPARPPRDAAADAPDAPDAAPRVGLGEVTVLDARGEPRTPTAIPRRPMFRITLDGPVPVRADAPAIYLLRGPLDDALLTDLAASPLRSENLSRAVPITVDVAPDALLVRPSDALASGAHYTLAVAAWLVDANGARVLGAPRALALQVSSSPDDGAQRVDSWPPDGAPGIGPNLPLVALRFDGRIVGARDAVYLARPDGAPVPAEVREPRCSELGWPDGYCVVAAPRAPLLRGAGYTLVAGEALRDGSGAPIGRSETHFTTSAEDDVTPPLPTSDETCGSDETSVDGGGCLLADDRSLSVRLRTTEPVRAFLVARVGVDSREIGAVAPRGEVALTLRALPASTTFDATLRIIDAAGLVVDRRASVATTAPLSTLSITEVRSDPRGPEPRQEYVEVLNFGPVPVDLRGFSLADRADDDGNLLTRAFLLPAGARALFVADAFDADDTRDDTPAPGVPLVRIGTSLGSGGLSNAGEPLYLRDPDGRRVSAAPALVPAAPGACVVRASPDPRDGAPAAFRHDALGGCTPGLADRAAPP